MKKLLIISLISSSLLLVGCFNQESKPEIKNQNVENIQSGTVQTGSVNENTGIIEQVLTGTVSNSGAESNSGIISNIQNETKTNSITFSDTQIKDILSKIDENTRKQQISTGILIQGDFKAEYIAPKDYSKDTDKIIVTISGKIYELPGVYGEKEKEEYIQEIKKGGCKGEVDGKEVILTPSSSYECTHINEFGTFINFSNDGKYILYYVYGYETVKYSLVDIEKGKVILNTFESMNTISWTLDGKQIIFGLKTYVASGAGLYITKKGDLSKVITIQDNKDVLGLFVDEKYIYSKEEKYLRIYDLNALKEVFSKEIVK